MEIYADVVFLINLFMDSFILWVVSKLDNRKTKLSRLFAGALVMAIAYCMLIFFTVLQKYLSILGSMVILMLGILIAFKPNNLKSFLKLMTLSYISAFFAGGLSVGLFYFKNISNSIGASLVFTVPNFSLKILLASTSFFYILIKLSLSWYRNITVKKQAFYPIKIFLKEEDISFTALLDTGNFLKDPMTKSPVIIAEFSSIEKFLPESLRNIFLKRKENDLELLTLSFKDTIFKDRIRLIPFSSLGKKNGMLVGFRPDKIEITDENNLITTVKDVVVGIYNCKLSGDNSYQGLLNPEVINVS